MIITRDTVQAKTRAFGYPLTIWDRDGGGKFSYSPQVRAQIGHVIYALSDQAHSIDDIAAAIGCSAHTAYRYARFWRRNVNMEAA